MQKTCCWHVLNIIIILILVIIVFVMNTLFSRWNKTWTCLLNIFIVFFIFLKFSVMYICLYICYWFSFPGSNLFLYLVHVDDRQVEAHLTAFPWNTQCKKTCDIFLYSRPGRAGLVTSRLEKEKSLTFFFSVGPWNFDANNLWWKNSNN